MTKELRRAQPDNSSLEITEKKENSINLALNNANARLRNDLTNLKQHVTARNQQLQQQCQFNDAIMDIAASPIVIIDADHRLIRFSKSCEVITGHDFEKFIGTTHWWKLVPDVDRELTRRVFDRLRDDEQAIAHENHWLNADGSKRNLSWVTTVLKDADDKVLYFVMTGIDITRQRRAELDARQHLEIASRLQRLLPANELTTLLAHELIQPLAAITMFVESGQQLLMESPSAATQLNRVLKQVSEQSVRAGEIIRRLRAFISRDAIRLVPLDLNRVIERVVIAMATSAHKSAIEIETNADISIPEVMADDVHVEQVLSNLLRNAIESIQATAMPEGKITVSSRRRQNRVLVTVCDSGAGIDADRADTIFEPSGSGSTKEHGLGVGLLISRSLIEAHGGRLWIEPSVPGAIVHFWLLPA